MNWNDIEAKWATMTRRVQSGSSGEKEGAAAASAPDQPPPTRDKGTELRAPALLDRLST